MKRGLDARVCVIGAGPSGITAAKHLLQVGLHNVVVYDANDQVGGNWIYSPDPGHSSVYETAHIISSRRLSQYHDYPMPDDWPDYPSHRLLLQYFQNYAEHFGVTDYIRFNTRVTAAVKQPDETWHITLDDGTTEIFDYLLVANGHHWDPRWPDYPGQFSGEYMHSHFYRTHLPYKGKRVLIIGGGNSACDIAVDISRHAAFVGLSWRRGYYVVPKIMFGQPPDIVNARLQWMPSWLRQRINYLAWRIAVGSNKAYGLPEPDHPITSSHPIINSVLLHHLRHGEVHPRPDVKCFDGSRVVFTDGRAEEYDVVIAATGYKVSFPFFEAGFLNFDEGEVPLYLLVFHPDHPSLAFIGLVQPQGCIWPLADTQGQLVANYIAGNYDWPADIRDRIARDLERRRKRYVRTPRHALEVDYHEYQNRLWREVPQNAPQWGQRNRTQ
ncbi:MAG: monooxygenase [Chloroflexi bacterium]|nr:MAG: monooxygenase [Chloroflexota bacterium]